MDIQHKELDKMRHEIENDIRAVFEKNMKVFDWDIPENDAAASARLILETMQKTLDVLKNERIGA
jgi:hypothetical protein